MLSVVAPAASGFSIRAETRCHPKTTQSREPPWRGAVEYALASRPLLPRAALIETGFWGSFDCPSFEKERKVELFTFSEGGRLRRGGR